MIVKRFKEDVKADYTAPWHTVWNRLRRPAVKELGFFGGVLRCFRGMKDGPFKKALAEVVWWDLCELKGNPTQERILREIHSYGFGTKEKMPIFSTAQEEKMRAKLEELGWVFSGRKRNEEEAAEA